VSCYWKWEGGGWEGGQEKKESVGCAERQAWKEKEEGRGRYERGANDREIMAGYGNERIGMR